jgi:putative transposase
MQRVSNYLRDRTPGATWFFTVVTERRRPWLCSPEAIAALRDAFAATNRRAPFDMIAAVVLPDHLHVMWSHPHGDAAFGKRWALIKRRVGQLVEPPADSVSTPSRLRRHERGLWQRRFWEHRIRDEDDLARHVDYIHFNPVKHGLVRCVAEWPHSSFHRFVAKGWLSADWAGSGAGKGDFGE